MTKPALLTVDDDPEVLHAIQRDLRERYADRYRILRAESGKAALEALAELPKPAGNAMVISLPRLSGLHHRYTWRQAA